MSLVLLIVLLLAGAAAAQSPPKPDLVVPSVTAPYVGVTPGASVKLKATVRNRGDGRSVASKLGFFLSRDRKRSKDDVALGKPVSTKALSSGARATKDATTTIPAGTAAGAYSLLACADARRKIGEKKEKNNCGSAPLTITAPVPPGALPYGNDALPGRAEAAAPQAGDLLLTEFFANPDPPDGNANNDIEGKEPDDEFVEFVNFTGTTLNLAGVTISDAAKTRHTFPPELLGPGCGAVVFSGGSPTGIPGQVVQTASTGTLELNNTGETVTIDNADQVEMTSHVFGNAEPNVSLSLPAAAPAEYVLHTSILGSIGGFSPGSLPDHSPFCTL